MTRRDKVMWLGVLALVFAVFPARGQDGTQDTQQDPRHANAMPLSEVRVGMKGYGRTVFQGTKIEPFAIEVMSIVSGSTPNRSVIWVRSDDPRLERSGPVQGMSGSPMYLWEEGKAGVVGIGGRLIGAFAFGYSDVKVCLVGVQPIEYMREVGQRTKAEDLSQKRARGVSGYDGLGALQAVATRGGADASARLYLDALQRLARPQAAHVDRDVAVRAPGRADAVGPMMLPMNVGSDLAATLYEPLLAPLGIAPLATGPGGSAGGPGRGVTSGPLPSNVDASAVRLEPGSVLSIPLGYGDMDLAAAGTVTDVLPDGTVLAFGHAMQAEGSARLPMATGFTHFVVPRNSISFKQTGTLDIVGSIVRDEQTAVAGVKDSAFFAAPVTVHVEMPGQPARDYHYHVVDAKPFTTAVVGLVAINSVSAIHAPAMQQTLRLTGKLNFDDGLTLDLDSLVAGEWSMGLTMDLLGPLAAIMNNPFEDARLESAELSITVKNELLLSSLVSATLDTPVARPGQTLRLAVTLEPFGKPTVTRTLGFKLPDNLAEGQYTMDISGADSYLNRMISARPDLAVINDLDKYVSGINEVIAVDRDAIYVGMGLPEMGVAVNGDALKELPSSRAAVFAATASSTLQPFMRFIEKKYRSDTVIEGDLSVTVTVQHSKP